MKTPLIQINRKFLGSQSKHRAPWSCETFRWTANHAHWYWVAVSQNYLTEQILVHL